MGRRHTRLGLVPHAAKAPHAAVHRLEVSSSLLLLLLLRTVDGHATVPPYDRISDALLAGKRETKRKTAGDLALKANYE
jgi:hypothetical protein